MVIVQNLVTALSSNLQDRISFYCLKVGSIAVRYVVNRSAALKFVDALASSLCLTREPGSSCAKVETRLEPLISIRRNVSVAKPNPGTPLRSSDTGVSRRV